MQPAPRLLTNKVSWRAFMLFVCCALIPLSALAVLALREVSVELRGQTERRLRRASKAVGLELNKRLLSLEGVIGVPEAQAPRLVEEDLPRPFRGVVRVTGEGSTFSLSGQAITPPSLSPEQLRHLTSGQSVLSVVSDSGQPARFYLSRALEPASPDAGFLHGEVNPDYLWSMEGEASIDYATRLIVLDDSGQVLLSSFDHAAASTVARWALSGPSGQFTWKDGNEDYFASYWSLFLRRRYHTSSWVVVLAQPSSDTFAPIASFNRTFLLVALLSFLLVLLLSFGQIRRILQPLARLHEATRRLAQGRLDTRVEIASGDEFEDLAGSFNQMASQLGHQFDALAMRREITVALSQGAATDAILQACVEILGRHLNLAVTGIWLIDDGGASLARHAIFSTAQDCDAAIERIPVGQGPIGRVAAEARPYLTDSRATELASGIPSNPPSTALATFVGHPLVIDGKVQGVLAAFAPSPLSGIVLGGLASAADEIAQEMAGRRVAQALRNSEEQVRQLQKMDAVGRLAGGIAHDFNNLLTVIIGYNELMLDELPPGDAKLSDLQIIRKTADRAARLTQQLLAFSRKQVLAPTLLDLNAIVAGMTTMLHRLIGANIDLVFAPSTTPTLVKVDRGQIEQVIMNLVVNARDAMPDGGRISIETACIELDPTAPTGMPATGQSRAVVLRVSDTGVGMDATTQAKLFEPFFTTKAPGKGTGLGLATVYGIVAQSDGSIQVESEPGRGTTFSIHLPLAAGTIEPPPTTNLPPARGDETVLVVEDEHEVRALIEQVLRGQGYLVLSAGRPSDALRIAEQHTRPIHLLLTDMVMPEMSGAALTERIRLHRPNIAVLQMSGYTEYRGGSDVGGLTSALLQKPFTPNVVAQAVRAALDAAPGR